MGRFIYFCLFRTFYYNRIKAGKGGGKVVFLGTLQNEFPLLNVIFCGLDGMSALVLPAPFVAIASREQYSTCRIRSAEDLTLLPAIWLGEQYYSFFRVVESASQALAMVAKLGLRNNAAALMKIPRGYSVWVEEPEAFPHIFPKLPSHVQRPAPSRMLTQSNQYKVLQLRVPDLDKPIQGIYYDNFYYSVFRQEANVQTVIDIVAQLALRGDESILLTDNRTWIVCILEPEATPV
jgi:hypothetical protein